MAFIKYLSFNFSFFSVTLKRAGGDNLLTERLSGVRAVSLEKGDV